jgi:hypothetical protein
MIDITPVPDKVNLYVVTFNAPKQLRLILNSFRSANPELLKDTTKILIDNSIDADAHKENDRLAREFGFKVIRRGNMGITGSRYWIATNFNESDSDYMLWFEDDMLLVDDQSLCKNGLNRHVADWLRKCIQIVKDEKLDFLKIAFTEFWGDHHKQWAWHNLPKEDQAVYFPDKDLRMKWSNSGVFSGLAYMLGEVYYSNWPCVMTKAGNRKIFLDPQYTAPPYEQDVMRDAFIRTRKGVLKSGVLMATLVNHNRVHFYESNVRKEA